MITMITTPTIPIPPIPAASMSPPSENRSIARLGSQRRIQMWSISEGLNTVVEARPVAQARPGRFAASGFGLGKAIENPLWGEQSLTRSDSGMLSGGIDQVLKRVGNEAFGGPSER